MFEWLCEGTGLQVEYLGGWNNPRNQKMLVFTPPRAVSHGRPRRLMIVGLDCVPPEIVFDDMRAELPVLRA